MIFQEIQPMNTLPKSITAHFFTDSAHYYALKRHWSALMNSQRKHQLAASHHMLYLALCGKDWRTAFTPISNPRKLANGAFYNWELFRSLAALHNPLHEDETLALFDGLITPDMLHKVSVYLPD